VSVKKVRARQLAENRMVTRVGLKLSPDFTTLKIP